MIAGRTGHPAILITLILRMMTTLIVRLDVDTGRLEMYVPNQRLLVLLLLALYREETLLMAKLFAIVIAIVILTLDPVTKRNAKKRRCFEGSS